MSGTQPPPFLELLNAGVARGGFETDDVLAVLMPLMKQVLAAHEAGLVAPLNGIRDLVVTDAGHLLFAPAKVGPPEKNTARVEAIQSPISRGVEVVGESRHTADLDLGSLSVADLGVGAGDADVVRPMFLPHYRSWEQAVGHHDELTDIFSLGLLLASVACGLDFTDAAHLEEFSAHRTNLFQLRPRLNPVLAAVAVQMTELNRHARARELGALISRLENYREQAVDFDTNIFQRSDFKGAPVAGKRRLIQSHLRDRLFEISRRNRLIHFKPTLQTLNLTIASVPVLLDYRNIRLEQLFVWHPELAAAVTEGAPMSLGKYLRFEDAPYIPGVLDKIISEARRDRAEYGFAQLRLVLCFLRWNNLREAPAERIHSPLLLLPVELTKKKGVRDNYVLDPTTSEAEVNPALRHYLRELYGLELPEFVDLKETTLAQFHEALRAQIQASEPGVTLHKVERPQIELIHEKARQRVDQYQRRVGFQVRKARRATRPDYSYDRDDLRPLGLQLFLAQVRPTPLPLRDAVGSAPLPRLPQASGVGSAGRPPVHPGLACPSAVVQRTEVGVAPHRSMVAPDSTPGRAPVTPAGGAGSTEPGAVETGIEDGKVLEAERQVFALRDGDNQNPYAWDFDLCSLTLGNFNYRKMTLVRDYAKLIETDMASQAFDRVFSLVPRPAEESPPALELADQHPVVACDATQATAIARARTGASYIIQGPPGTGKSQTITNLIADYVARGKRVLFVCEKRAAIDVVFHRLRQQGLDELCCLIHDSQTDKKAFILNLKQTYETFLSQAGLDPEADKAREAALKAMDQDLALLGRFSEVMGSAHAHTGVPVRSLLHRLVALRGRAVDLPPEVDDLLPGYPVWQQHGEAVGRLHSALADLGLELCFARHPLRWLGNAVLQAERPLEALAGHLDLAEGLLDAIESALELSGLPPDLWDTFAEIRAILDFATRAQPLASRGLLGVLTSGSVTHAFKAVADQLDDKAGALMKALEKTAAWLDPLSPDDVENALVQARAFEKSVFRFLQPAFWRLKRTLRTRYDFSRHAVAPTWSRILTDLSARYRAQAEHETLRRQTAIQWQTEDVDGFRSMVTALQADALMSHPSVKALVALLSASGEAGRLVETLVGIRTQFAELDATLRALLAEHERFGFPELVGVLTGLREQTGVLAELAPVMAEVSELPEALRHALRHAPVALNELEAAIAHKSIRRVYREDRGVSRFEGRTLARKMEQLEKHHHEWLDLNARCIRMAVRRTFLEHVQVSSLPASQLSPEQKLFKKSYAAGRRDLEHEFGKTMRYKSIRDLAAGDTGQVVQDLKPIWLMSPLSVSDTLPLDPELFDVVIFDEASQIPLEEAIPAVYRSHQVIIVGDEMQLPPTTFFASARVDEDSVVVEAEGERFEVDLDSDSFLTQSAQNLPSTLLAWHYRSRYESLISFSNAAFYSGNLNTIPDRQRAVTGRPGLVVTANEQGAANVDALLSRSISFHSMAHGCYEDRRNPNEAAYIAQLVRGLLQRDTKLSIGIVAFSEAQQTEIEAALARLAEEDAAFGSQLESESVREENDVFCGLFVKNLENVQGDERDIILMSVCYGRDAGGRMLMNFGPINQRGGEKRLNVIFSRAKHHMAIVSSIRHLEITNDHNDGANSLKNFLHYAEAISAGDEGAARRVLEGLNPLSRRALAPASRGDAVVEALAAALRARGYAVELNVGQSKFRCDLAVRQPADSLYQLGVLVDTDGHYANLNLLDRYLLQPSILRAFGWRFTLVLTKDWYHDPDEVLARLEKLLLGQESLADAAAPEEEPAEVIPPVEQPPRATPVEPALAPPMAASVATPKPGAAPGPLGSSSAPAAALTRRFEFVGGSSRKFWEITVAGDAFTVRFGRMETAGQSQTKTFAEAATASREAERLIAEKKRKGYAPVDPGGAEDAGSATD